MMGQILLLDNTAQFGTKSQCKIEVKSNTQQRSVEWAFQDKEDRQIKIQKNVNKQEVFFLQTNENKDSFIQVNVPRINQNQYLLSDDIRIGMK